MARPPPQGKSGARQKVKATPAPRMNWFASPLTEV
jgi:hypothetical protein